jgi:hypothetical protein
MNARTKLEQLGPLDGFEQIEGVHPLHVKEILAGAQFSIKLLERKASQKRSPRLEVAQ